jgi:hypothetical protein
VRVCAEPGCPTLTSGRRCPIHQAEYERARGTRQQRGYTAGHDALRKAWQRRMDAGETVHCWRCTRVIDPNNWHLGHDDHDRTVYRGPECPLCNLQAGGRARHTK